MPFVEQACLVLHVFASPKPQTCTVEVEFRQLLRFWTQMGEFLLASHFRTRAQGHCMIHGLPSAKVNDFPQDSHVSSICAKVARDGHRTIRKSLGLLDLPRSPCSSSFDRDLFVNSRFLKVSPFLINVK